MGFRNFTDALLDQYSDGAFRTANTAVMEFDVSKIEDYAASGGTTDEYIAALESMERLCNSSGSTFIYVIRPDLSDYKHITFLFSTINENSDYTRYEFGFVRDTTNEEYMEKYRRLYEGKSDQELVIRDKGYIAAEEIFVNIARYLCPERSNAFVVAMLWYAMLTGSDIRFEAPVSKQLYDGLTGTLIPALAKGGFRAIRLEGEVTSERVETQGGVVSGLSCGAVFEMLDNGNLKCLITESVLH